MASVVLSVAGGVVGGLVGGPLGARIGAALGAAIGGMIDNQLFPQKQEGPRLTDLSAQDSTYGGAIPLGYGPENRMAGNIFWSSGLLETVTKKKQGGKGGPTVQTTEYSYRSHVAVGLLGAEITRVRKIWANTKLIFDDSNLSQPIYNTEDGTHALFSTLTVYPGNFTQNPDPTIEAALGVGNTPAYRGTAYCVIADLQLADYGNRLPNLEFLVEVEAESSVAGAVLDIVERAGMDPNTVSVFSLAADTLRGFVIANTTQADAALQPLALVYDFDLADRSGNLMCLKRGRAAVGVIPLAELGAQAPGDDRPEPITWSRIAETVLPRQATITFADPERDYQANSQSEVRTAGNSQNNLASEVAVVMGVDVAKAVAQRMLWEAQNSRTTADTSLTDRWIHTGVGETYLVETPAGFEPLRITRKSRGANGVNELEMRRDDAALYQASATGTPASVPSNTVEIPGQARLILLDIPLLLDADEGPGFYYAVVGAGTGWRGADVLRAISILGSYEEVSPQGVSAISGEIVGVVADGATGGWDDTTVITVTLASSSDSLESLSDDEVLAGGNACFVGLETDTSQGEILAFGTATQLDAVTWELSHLRRGLRGTEFATSLHGSGESFVRLELGAILRADFGAADLNQARFYKAVSLLTSASDADAVIFTNTGVALRPWAPIDLAADIPSPGGDATLTWTARNHKTDGPGLGESAQVFTLDILDEFDAPVRTVSLDSPSFVYTAAMQTADFGAPVSGQLVAWRVAQVSSIYGDGVYGLGSFLRE